MIPALAFHNLGIRQDPERYIKLSKVRGIVHYDTSATKLFRTSVSLQHETKASDVIKHSSRKLFSHEYRTKFYITRCENADFRTRSVRKTAFYTRSDIKIISHAAALPFSQASDVA